MRIRKKYNPILFIAALFLFFGLALMTTEISASTLKNKTKWQMGKSIVISQKDVQYHVYLSKNKKESWIYKIELKKKIRKLVIPKKINHASVTRIGYGMELYGDDDDCYYSVFGDVLEPWHECYGEESKKKNAIVEIVFPKTLKQIEAGSFSGMKRLKKARIPDKVEMIPCFSFSACPSLKSVVLPGKMNGIDNYAFAESSNISTLFIENNCKKYTVENGILIDKLKNNMVWVVSAKKTVVIPSTVTGIADYAFLASQANTVMIPKSLKKIGKKALTATKIQNVSFYDD
ncbi:MAG: leucine-rich repeat domain-containing protein [Eubacterium sp.]